LSTEPANCSYSVFFEHILLEIRIGTVPIGVIKEANTELSLRGKGNAMTVTGQILIVLIVSVQLCRRKGISLV